MLEMRDCIDGFTGHLPEMLLKCRKLESFCLKIRLGAHRGADIVCPSIEYVNFLPDVIKSLTLEPVNEDQAVGVFCGGANIVVYFLFSVISLHSRNWHLFWKSSQIKFYCQSPNLYLIFWSWTCKMSQVDSGTDFGGLVFQVRTSLIVEQIFGQKCWEKDPGSLCV